MQILNEQQQIGEIVAINYRAAGLFRRYGIDFCCGGGISLEEACRRKKLNTLQLLNELQQECTESGGSENYAQWSVPLLTTYIVETHHRYVRRKSEELLAFAAKVASRHGNTHPENTEIYHLLSALVPELMEHLVSEESHAFPLITKATREVEENGKISDDLKKRLNELLEEMENEHESAGDIMKQIRLLSHDYTTPSGACQTYQVLYKGLEEFEQDLHKHVHLENNILFKKARKLLNT
ncbi:MAG: iron-sulfur cluster repair di-iron protein [Balneolales bacterium]|nr:iron-sulfur cluster repair di-iron protein [Balneolales bacterium]